MSPPATQKKRSSQTLGRMAKIIASIGAINLSCTLIDGLRSKDANMNETPVFSPLINNMGHLQVKPRIFHGNWTGVAGASTWPAAVVEASVRSTRRHGGNCRNGRYHSAVRDFERSRVFVISDEGLGPLDVILPDSSGSLLIGKWKWIYADRMSRQKVSDADRVGEVTLDADDDGLGYSANPGDGPWIAGIDLKSDHLRFMFFVSPSGPHDVIWRRGSHFLVLGWNERNANPTGPVPDRARLHLIEADINKPDIHRIVSETVLADLQFTGRPFCIAVNGNDVIVAIPNHLYRFNEKLELIDEVAAEFEPLALSLDEASRVYLAVRIHNKTEFWIVDSSGNRYLRAALPAELPDRVHPTDGYLNDRVPPLIGFDHTTFIILKDRIVSIDLDGAIRWSYATAEPSPGAIVTAENVLVASVGTRVVRIAPNGEATILYDTKNEPITTAPAFLEDRLYLGTAERVLELVEQRE
jgi:hypothetical protein